MFIDEIELEVHAGKGGAGAVAFRRAKFMPRGGPWGGDGGDGGDVCLLADDAVSTFFHLRNHRIIKAKNGAPGVSKNQHGPNAETLEVSVPVGSLIYDAESGELLADLIEQGQRYVVARGGKGGRGNSRFATATNRAPTRADSGMPGESRRLRLELKLLADVGLLGYPSVGKSTLIRQVTNARPKVAEYHFTTLSPKLGVVQWRDHQHFVIADIPGIIEGASEGRGLGQQFLRHLERCQLLLHVIEVTAQLDEAPSERDPIADFERLCLELERFAPELAERPQVVVLNKLDLPHVREAESKLRQHFEERGLPFFAISAVSGEGVEPLVDHLGVRVIASRS
ncbi:MAG: GTPase ObgE [Myxococcota bacterium]|jgi:GTP-binding protein|nr:GTPase ObgE [Myxococcota bacterium]